MFCEYTYSASLYHYAVFFFLFVKYGDALVLCATSARGSWTEYISLKKNYNLALKSTAIQQTWVPDGMHIERYHLPE